MEKFMTKWEWRCTSLYMISWIMSLTATAGILVLIKKKKFYYYARSIFPDGNFKSEEAVNIMYNSYWSDQVMPIIYCLPVLIIIDCLLRKYIFKVT